MTHLEGPELAPPKRGMAPTSRACCQDFHLFTYLGCLGYVLLAETCAQQAHMGGNATS